MNARGQTSVPSTGGSPPLSLQATPLEISDHELIRRIGKGSYGEVWLVRNLLGSYRAVKFVERSAFSEARPFERELEGIRRFEPISRTHPGFVSILHVGRNERQGYFYYIMELADDVAAAQAIDPERYKPRTLGSDLARLTRLPLSECLQIGLSLTAALKHLHQHGLVHRDIKPSNIVFIRGSPKLADIGLVTAISQATTCLGTRGYVSPEDAGSPAADLYSLGKVLYELHTGNPPEQFPDLPVELTHKSESDRAVRFNDVLLRACDTQPQKRYRSADALRAALTHCLQRGANPGETDVKTTSTTGVLVEPGRAERRRLTVLVVNITMTAYADPEEVQALVRGCLESIRSEVERYEGKLAQILSDGAMAVFGGAVAVEDHARRATHAGIAILRSLAAHRSQLHSTGHSDFEVRVGVNTGLAIATRDGHGHPPAGGAASPASRVAHLAEPGQLLITEETWKATRDYFVTRALGERPAPGLTAATRVYEVVGARGLRTRLEVEMERGLTPLVGRVKELAILGQRLAEVRTGRGQMVLLAGEPGVGKSRLLFEFKRALQGQEVCWLDGRAISFGSQMAYLPIIEILRRLFRIEEADDRNAIAARIEAEAEALGREILSALPFVKHLLSLPLHDDCVAAMDPPQRRVNTFEALRKLLLKQAQRHPVILAVEDLHWIDRTSQDFLVSLADSLTMAPILVLLTYRPDYPNPFPERSFITRLTLQPLTDDESLRLANQMLTVTAVPDELRKLVIAKAEGNPFFVEEIIKSLLEAGMLGPREGRFEALGSFSQPQVPDTVQDVIMSRIDRLEESPRRTLQLASVIGREFSVSLLETITDLSEPLVDSLQKLKSLELIYERSLFPEYTCCFKHALTQEVAYHSLLLQRRRELHCLVAAALEELHAARLGEFYELLAYHYERGEEWERALDYLRRAAERCRSVAAHREEASHLSRAIAIAQRLGQTDSVTDLRGQRGAAWIKVGRWAEARPELETALSHLAPENPGRRAELLSSLAAACFWGLDIAGTQRCAEEGYVLAEETRRDDLVAELLTWRGATQQALGHLRPAIELFERARAKGGGCSSATLANYPLSLYLNGRIHDALERAREAAEKFRSLSDNFAAAFGHPHLGLALAACGHYSEAARVFDEAKQLALKHEIWPFHARAFAASAGFHLDVFDLPGNEAVAQEARERARSAPFRPSEVSADIDLVFNFTRRGEIARAEALHKEAAALAVQIGGWHRWLWAIRLRQAHAELASARGEWVSALELASSAIAESGARGRNKYLVAGMETRAKALAALGRTSEAIVDLRHAVERARSMGDPALFLRVATTLLLIDGDDLLLAETQATARKILAELPDQAMRHRFQTAEPVRRLGPL